MGRYRLLPSAEIELEAIHEYTTETWGSAQAKTYLSGLRRCFENLARHPLIAPLANPGSPIRIALYREHRILYRPGPEGIEVGRVLHQARDFARILDRFRDLAERDS